MMTSTDAKQREILGIVIDELDALDAARRQNRSHQHEERLNGDHLSDVKYLKLRTGGNSIRIYFVEYGHICMLALDVGKRRTNITDGLAERLRARVRDVKKTLGKL